VDAKKILEFDMPGLDIVELENLVVKRVTEPVSDNGEVRYSKEKGVGGRTL
jgi:hypothetical protein